MMLGCSLVCLFVCCYLEFFEYSDGDIRGLHARRVLRDSKSSSPTPSHRVIRAPPLSSPAVPVIEVVDEEREK